MALTRASGYLRRLEVEETNRPNLAGYPDSPDLGDPSSDPVQQVTGFAWWKVALGALAAYALWKGLK
jgi:hypothetical protein